MANTAELELSVIEKCCPGKTLAQVEGLMPAIIEKTEQRLRKQTVSENAKLISTNYRCNNCKNVDQGSFVEDMKAGQVTCMLCGVVTEARKVHDGDWKRQFSGEDNPSQHGPAPDPRFSSGHNLRTNITGGSGKGAAAKVTKKEVVDLKNVQEKVEMNLSNMQFGVDVRMTRIGYKDKQKKEVFLILEDVGDKLTLHPKLIETAKSYFADYRTAMEQIQQRDAVTAACLIIALRNTLAGGDDVYADSSTKSLKRPGPGREAVRAVKVQRTYEELHPFACKRCSNHYASRKELRLHACKGK